MKRHQEPFRRALGAHGVGHMNEGTRQIDTGRRALSSASDGAHQGRQVQPAQTRGGHAVDEVGEQQTLPLEDCADALLDTVRGEDSGGTRAPSRKTAGASRPQMG